MLINKMKKIRKKSGLDMEMEKFILINYGGEYGVYKMKE
jgi:hypothetical protein